MIRRILSSVLLLAMTATAAFAAPPATVSFTGQLLDVRNGYAYFTTGDAFRVIDVLRIVDYDSGQPTTIPPQTKMFARAIFDQQTKQIIELDITKHKLAQSQDFSAVRSFIVVKSTPEPAPEIVGQKLTGKAVAVTFEITVPPTTSLQDVVYISTDASGWNPQAIRLDRIDAYKYRATRQFASGTKFAYRVTRGSWNSTEVAENGLQPDPHQFFVREVDAQAARTQVYHWSDQNPTSQGAGPNAIPTPYNSNPFGGGPGGILVPQRPTPVPTPPR